MAVRSVKEVKQNLSRYLRQVGRQPLVITKNGRPCAGVVELKDDGDVEAFLVANNKKLMAMFDRSLTSQKWHPRQDVEKMIEEAERKARKTRKAA